MIESNADLKHKKKLLEFLRTTFIFSSVKEDRLEALISSVNIECLSYQGGEIIYSPSEFDKKVGFVFSGECTVERERPDGAAIPLNVLHTGDTFGILAAFSCEERFPTSVRAKRASQIIFITKEDLVKLIKSEPEIALNIVSFMSGRISFLNEKIATFSVSGVEKKLASLLLSEARHLGENGFPFNFKKTAEMLNAGRASIYRAIDALMQKSLIKLENKKIYIIDLVSLERISK